MPPPCVTRSPLPDPTHNGPSCTQGKFVTFYGKNFTADEMARNISDHVKRWKAEHPQWGKQ